jgi:hypothetical protein
MVPTDQMMRYLLFLIACAGPGQSVRKTDAVLVVQSNVPAASVYIDEGFSGRAADLGRGGIRVAHGTLRVEVRADGYFPAYKDVVVRTGETARVEVPLKAIPEGE